MINISFHNLFFVCVPLIDSKTLVQVRFFVDCTTSKFEIENSFEIRFPRVISL